MPQKIKKRKKTLKRFNQEKQFERYKILSTE